jgi:hypothetical protein
MELPSATVNNQAWQFNEEEVTHGSITSASPKNPDLEKIIAAKSQEGPEASPSPNRHSPITSSVTASPPSISTSSAAAATMADGLQNTVNSIFKAKLEESVKKGKGTELPYSPKKANAAPMKVLASGSDVPAKRALVSKPISARKPPVF